MKTRLIVVLLGLFSVFGSTSVLAHSHGHGHRGAYGGSRLISGFSIWDDSYGHAGFLSLGFGRGHATGVYETLPYYDHTHVPTFGHTLSYRYDHGYGHGRSYRRNSHRRFNNSHRRRH